MSSIIRAQERLELRFEDLQRLVPFGNELVLSSRYSREYFGDQVLALRFGSVSQQAMIPTAAEHTPLLALFGPVYDMVDECATMAEKYDEIAKTGPKLEFNDLVVDGSPGVEAVLGAFSSRRVIGPHGKAFSKLSLMMDMSVHLADLTPKK
jgi:hypothetical protein